MDAFPGYTYFDKSKQVLCVIQVVEDSEAAAASQHSVMMANDTIEHGEPLTNDSAVGVPTVGWCRLNMREEGIYISIYPSFLL